MFNKNFIIIFILIISISFVYSWDAETIPVCYSDSTGEFMILCLGDSAPIGKLPSPIIPGGGGPGGGGGCGSLSPESRGECCRSSLFNGTEGFDYFYNETSSSCESIPLIPKKKFDIGIYLPFIIIGILALGFWFFILWRRREEKKKKKDFK